MLSQEIAQSYTHFRPHIDYIHRLCGYFSLSCVNHLYNVGITYAALIMKLTHSNRELLLLTYFATHIKTRTTRIIAPHWRCTKLKMPTVRLLLLCTCCIYVQQCDSQSVLQGRRVCMHVFLHVLYVI